ncbi:MAG: DNA mismatch repair endonuclease MutL [Gammaproteobacteria bacterium]|nr:DNA mismatch repair endonuclease MutL [Gammaproteobacteria bacterium]
MNSPEIRALTDAVINQIAAGEVVERPVSIVKELVENSLDAGATRIDIEIDGGGCQRIAVRDNGGGIPPGEFALALRRHCTSKLRGAEELARLVTLGFRGEALAAIGAVSDLQLTSRIAAQAHGWQVTTNAHGLPGQPVPAPHPVGTSVVVRDLFGRVPARRRFLRQAQTEALHVLALVRRIAFSAPAVAFNLLRDGQRALSVPAALDEASAARRLRALFGVEFAALASRVEMASQQIRVAGYLAGPALARSQADLQMLAVNGRTIRDRQLAHAVRLAYGERLPEGRHACYALQIDLPPAAVDVNVHPGKIEVRFQDLREVHDLLHAAVRAALNGPQAPAVAVEHAYETTGGPRELVLRVADAGRPAGPRPSFAARVAHPVHPAAVATHWVALIAGRYAVSIEEVPDAPAAALGVVDLVGFATAVLAARLQTQWASAPALPSRPLLFPIRIECRDGAHAQALEAALAALGLSVNALSARTLALRSLPLAAPAVLPEVLGPALARHPPRADAGYLATALGEALAVPTLGAERASWWARLQGMAAELAIALGPYETRLDAAGLARLVAASHAPG